MDLEDDEPATAAPHASLPASGPGRSSKLLQPGFLVQKPRDHGPVGTGILGAGLGDAPHDDIPVAADRAVPHTKGPAVRSDVRARPAAMAHSAVAKPLNPMQIVEAPDELVAKVEHAKSLVSRLRREARQRDDRKRQLASAESDLLSAELAVLEQQHKQKEAQIEAEKQAAKQRRHEAAIKRHAEVQARLAVLRGDKYDAASAVAGAADIAGHHAVGVTTMAGVSSVATGMSGAAATGAAAGAMSRAPFENGTKSVASQRLQALSQPRIPPTKASIAAAAVASATANMEQLAASASARGMDGYLPPVPMAGMGPAGAGPAGGYGSGSGILGATPRGGGLLGGHHAGYASSSMHTGSVGGPSQSQWYPPAGTGASGAGTGTGSLPHWHSSGGKLGSSTSRSAPALAAGGDPIPVPRSGQVAVAARRDSMRSDASQAGPPLALVPGPLASPHPHYQHGSPMAGPIPMQMPMHAHQQSPYQAAVMGGMGGYDQAAYAYGASSAPLASSSLSPLHATAAEIAASATAGGMYAGSPSHPHVHAGPGYYPHPGMPTTDMPVPVPPTLASPASVPMGGYGDGYTVYASPAQAGMPTSDGSAASVESWLRGAGVSPDFRSPGSGTGSGVGAQAGYSPAYGPHASLSPPHAHTSATAHTATAGPPMHITASASGGYAGSPRTGGQITVGLNGMPVPAQVSSSTRPNIHTGTGSPLAPRASIGHGASPATGPPVPSSSGSAAGTSPATGTSGAPLPSWHQPSALRHIQAKQKQLQDVQMRLAVMQAETRRIAQEEAALRQEVAVALSPQKPASGHSPVPVVAQPEYASVVHVHGGYNPGMLAPQHAQVTDTGSADNGHWQSTSAFLPGPASATTGGYHPSAGMPEYSQPPHDMHHQQPQPHLAALAPAAASVHGTPRRELVFTPKHAGTGAGTVAGPLPSESGLHSGSGSSGMESHARASPHTGSGTPIAASTSAVAAVHALPVPVPVPVGVDAAGSGTGRSTPASMGTSISTGSNRSAGTGSSPQATAEAVAAPGTQPAGSGGHAHSDAAAHDSKHTARASASASAHPEHGQQGDAIDAQAAAATSIQAVFRGHATRRASATQASATGKQTLAPAGAESHVAASTAGVHGDADAAAAGHAQADAHPSAHAHMVPTGKRGDDPHANAPLAGGAVGGSVSASGSGHGATGDHESAQAATRIQAVFRGHAQRKSSVEAAPSRPESSAARGAQAVAHASVSDLQDGGAGKSSDHAHVSASASVDPSDASAGDTKPGPAGAGVEQTAAERHDGSADAAAAATRIQAVYKGHATRKGAGKWGEKDGAQRQGKSEHSGAAERVGLVGRHGNEDAAAEADSKASVDEGTGHPASSDAHAAPVSSANGGSDNAAAAVRIQAVYRGHATRKAGPGARKPQPEPSVQAEAPAASDGHAHAEPESHAQRADADSSANGDAHVDAHGPTSHSDAQAATRIQAVYRGHAGRKAVVEQRRKGDKRGAVKDSETAHADAAAAASAADAAATAIAAADPSAAVTAANAEAGISATAVASPADRAAAVKIQSVYRGHQTRAKVQPAKGRKGGTGTASGGEDERPVIHAPASGDGAPAAGVAHGGRKGMDALGSTDSAASPQAHQHNDGHGHGGDGEAGDDGHASASASGGGGHDAAIGISSRATREHHDHERVPVDGTSPHAQERHDEHDVHHQQQVHGEGSAPGMGMDTVGPTGPGAMLDDSLAMMDTGSEPSLSPQAASSPSKGGNGDHGTTGNVDANHASMLEDSLAS